MHFQITIFGLTILCMFSRLQLAESFVSNLLKRGSQNRATKMSTQTIGDLPIPISGGLSSKKVIILAGATSVGKSAVAAELCRRMDAEIIVADSVQIYKHLNIGSNKPSQGELDSVPHHMVDLVEPNETFSCGDFVRAAAPIIFDILDRGKVPVIVGGSTMWIQWLVHGMPDAPKADERTVKQAEEMLQDFEAAGDWEQAVELVGNYDKSRVEKLGRNDWYRLHRYLEISLSVQNEGSRVNDNELISDSDKTNTVRDPTISNNDIDTKLVGSSTSSVDTTGRLKSTRDVAEGNEKSDVDNEYSDLESAESLLTGRRNLALPGIDIRCFFLSEEKDQLYHYIDTRCEVMLKDGLFEEVSQLLINKSLTPEALVARAIGYRQTIDYLCSGSWEPTDNKAFEAYMRVFAAATRNYAKRQFQWYRKDKSFLWLKIDRSLGGVHDLSAYEKICTEIQHWYHKSSDDYKSTLDRQISRGLAVTAIRNKKVSSSGYRKKSLDHSFSAPTDILETAVTSALFEDDDRSLFSEDEVRALEAIRQAKRSDIDLSAFLSPEHWSADELLIRAAEGLKKSIVLKTYVNDFKGGSAFNALITEADRCAQELREKNPGVVQEFRDITAATMAKKEDNKMSNAKRDYNMYSTTERVL